MNSGWILKKGCKYSTILYFREINPTHTRSFREVSRSCIYQNASASSEQLMLSHRIKLRIFCLKSLLLMSSDFIANTSLPEDYMENKSIPSYAFEMFLMPLIQQKNPAPFCPSAMCYRVSWERHLSTTFT